MKRRGQKEQSKQGDKQNKFISIQNLHWYIKNIANSINIIVMCVYVCVCVCVCLTDITKLQMFSPPKFNVIEVLCSV